MREVLNGLHKLSGECEGNLTNLFCEHLNFKELVKCIVAMKEKLIKPLVVKFIRSSTFLDLLAYYRIIYRYLKD